MIEWQDEKGQKHHSLRFPTPYPWLTFRIEETIYNVNSVFWLRVELEGEKRSPELRYVKEWAGEEGSKRYDWVAKPNAELTQFYENNVGALEAIVLQSEIENYFASLPRLFWRPDVVGSCARVHDVFVKAVEQAW